MIESWIEEELRLAAEAWDEMPDAYKKRVNADYWANPA